MSETAKSYVPPLKLLIDHLKKTTDLAVFDVVVVLDGAEPNVKARIVIPASDRPAMEHWLKAFSITENVTWDWDHPGSSHVRVWFPITI